MKKFRAEQVGEIFNRLYDSEINAKIEWFFDAGFRVNIGDFANGWIEAQIPDMDINWCLIEDVISVLAWQAKETYPESDFAEWYEKQVDYLEICRKIRNGEVSFFGPQDGNTGGVLSFDKSADPQPTQQHERRKKRPDRNIYQ